MATIATETQPSFYYMLIAQTCFHRSRTIADQVRSRALSETGRDFLAKARPAPMWLGEPRNAA